MEYLIVVYAVVLVILLILSFFFSSSDMAYGSVNLKRMESKLGSKRSKVAYKLTKNYDKTISTILLFNDTINAGLDSISTLLGVTIATDIAHNGAISDTAGLIASMIMLVIKIIFGEIIAKALGKIYNYKLVNVYAYIIQVCYWITLPITFVIGGFGTLVCMPITRNVKDLTIKKDELMEMVDEIHEQGIIDEDKAELIQNTITYTQTEIYEIMTPRTKICAYEINTPLEEVISDKEVFLHSRIPLYDDTIDNIVGYFTTKDLFKLKLKGVDIEETKINTLLREIEFFPRTLEINDLLNHFKETKTEIAVVLDEYGGTEGIITREDIIEEIVGEIWDETDKKNEPIIEKSDGTYIVDGDMNLEDYCFIFDIDFEEIDTSYVTIGGFIIELLDDKFAKLGDKIKFGPTELEVIAISKKFVVKKLLVSVIEEEEKEKVSLKDKISSLDRKKHNLLPKGK